MNDKNVLLDCLKSVSKNLFVRGKEGKRYKGTLMDFYLGCLIMGGPRLAEYMSVNLFGPHVDHLLKVKSKRRFKCDPGCTSRNFENVASIYKKLMPSIPCKSVPSLAAEDETACIPEVRWMNMDPVRDVLLGFCGEKSDDHKCSEDFMVVVGNDPGAYQRIKGAFDNNVIGYMIRVIMINPLHTDLPPLVVLSMPTCNKFDHTDVQRQWAKVDDLYNEHIKPVLGGG